MGCLGQSGNESDMDEVHQEVKHPVLTGIEKEFQQESEHIVDRLSEVYVDIRASNDKNPFLSGTLYVKYPKFQSIWRNVPKTIAFLGIIITNETEESKNNHNRFLCD